MHLSPQPASTVWLRHGSLVRVDEWHVRPAEMVTRPKAKSALSARGTGVRSVAVWCRSVAVEGPSRRVAPSGGVRPRRTVGAEGA